MYDNAEYANSRLQGTIVRLNNGRPITIMGLEDVRGGEIHVDYRTLSTNRQGSCELTDIDLTPVPLGWVNNPGNNASYLARMPMRHDWRQGLRVHNYTSLFGPDKRFVSNASLSRAIQGKHLDIDGAIEEASNTRKMIPFSRDFAVNKSGKRVFLYFKWTGVVGDVVNDIVNLNEDFNHLQESLERDL